MKDVVWPRLTFEAVCLGPAKCRTMLQITGESQSYGGEAAESQKCKGNFI